MHSDYAQYLSPIINSTVDPRFTPHNYAPFQICLREHRHILSELQRFGNRNMIPGSNYAPWEQLCPIIEFGGHNCQKIMPPQLCLPIMQQNYGA